MGNRDKELVLDEEPTGASASSPAAVSLVDSNQVLSKMFTGLLGLCMALAALAIIFALPLINEGEKLSVWAYLLFLALSMGFLSLGRIFAGTLQTTLGGNLVLVGNIVGFVGCVVPGLFPVLAVTSYLYCFFLSLAFASTTLIWGEFLAELIGDSLILLVTIAMVFVGFVSLVSVFLPKSFALVLAGIFVLISWATSFSYVKSVCKKRILISNAESEERHLRTKGNKHTLFLNGLMLGAVARVFFIGVSAQYACAMIGVAMALAGAITLLVMRSNIDQARYIDTLKKSLALVTALCLLPQLLFGMVGQLLFMGIFIVFVSMNLILVICAVAETARFSEISPIWINGFESSVVLIGACASFMLMVLCDYVPIPTMGEGGRLSSAAIPFVLVVVAACYMQIFVNYQVYPFESIFVEEANDKGEEEDVGGKRKAIWAEKRRQVGEYYKLSERQKEIMRLLTKGRDTKFIMDEFQISHSTAKTHIYNLYKKLDVHSRQDLLDLIDNFEISSKQ